MDDTNNRGIWLSNRSAPGSLQLVARTGSPAPGTANDVNFSELWFAAPALNDAGQIAFTAALTGSGVDETNNFGIWATDADGALQLIARNGELLEVAAGDFRTIDGLNMMVGNDGSDGRPERQSLPLSRMQCLRARGPFLTNITC